MQDSDYDCIGASQQGSKIYHTLCHWSASDSGDSGNESPDHLTSDEELNSEVSDMSMGCVLNEECCRMGSCLCAGGMQEPCACAGDGGWNQECLIECALTGDSGLGGSLNGDPCPEDRCALDGIAEDLLSAGVPDFGEASDACVDFDCTDFRLEEVEDDVSVCSRTLACMHTFIGLPGAYAGVCV